MRRLLLLLVLVVLVSGCVNWGGSKATFGLSEMTTNPDAYLKIESSTSEIKSGRSMQLQFTVQNKGNTPLNATNVTAYDQCLFIGDSFKNVSELKANRTDMWTWRWNATDTDFETDCEIKFRTVYETRADTSTSFYILDESEYYAREEKGTLTELKSTTSSTDSSLSITSSFSESQPFLSGEYIYVYINYEDIGPGILNQIDRGSAKITVPTTMVGTCSGYTKTGSDTYVSDSALKFTNKKAPSTTCKFKTNATQSIEAGILRITATYKYQFDNSLLLKVKPK